MKSGKSYFFSLYDLVTLRFISKLRLSSRFVLYVTILVLIIMSLVAVTTVTRERRALVVARVQRGELLAEALYVICAEALQTGKTDALTSFVERLHRVDELVSITLLDGQGEVWWSHVFRPEEKSEISAEPLIYGEILNMKYFFKMGEYMYIENPVFDPAMQRYGTIRLRLSLAGVKEELSRAMTEITVISIAAVLMVSLLSVFLAQMIIGPVGSISRAVTRVAAGDFEQRLDASRADELGEMAAAFNSMTRALQKMADNSKLANLGKLAASVAHEIRNPLVTIRGLVEYMSSLPEIPEESRADLQIVLSEADRLNSFVQRLLDFASPVSGARQPCDLVSIIQDVSPILEVQAKSQGVRLEKKLPASAPFSGNIQELKQVFFNLISNAIQACDRDGRVTVLMEKKHDPEVLEVHIVDDGCGIPGEIQEQIFDPFVTTRSAGTGLGLPLARRAVEMHGGSIKVVSAVSLGTRMTVCLPGSQP